MNPGDEYAGISLAAYTHETSHGGLRTGRASWVKLAHDVVGSDTTTGITRLYLLFYCLK